ncbi:hypothetical protein KEM56_006460 [Ascosphaera pollenicola]|nr:hypothetical protein KEM56_006460 [Ascosphaera pollenicola]
MGLESAMKELTISKISGKVTQSLDETSIPKPKPNEVVIKVAVVGLNPKDWKFAGETKSNQGDDIAGYIYAVGSDVRNFKPGDRVCAYHDMLEANGGYAQYAIAEENFTIHLPQKISFEEAATIPLPALTAALGLFQELDLPYPWKPATEAIPLLVYGAGTTVASYAIKFAKLANIHPIIAVAGKSGPVVEPLLDANKGDKIIDYRDGPEATIKKINEALNGEKCYWAIDTVNEDDSARVIDAVVDAEKGKASVVGPLRSKGPVTWKPIFVKSVHTDANGLGDKKALGTIGYREFGISFFQLIGRGLAAGWFSGHHHKVVPKGLDGLVDALNETKEGKVSAFRYVVRIEDTPSL